MEISNNLFIERYNQSNSAEFKKNKHKLPKEFEILHIQTFCHDKNIYILQKYRVFLKPKIIGYAIICDFNGMTIEEKSYYAKLNRLHTETFINHSGYYIEDFMITKSHRRQGYATYFFKLLRQQFYNDYDLLLCADGDGLNFWDKIGFVNVDKMTSTMIRKSNS